jgi:hypothetical protein
LPLAKSSGPRRHGDSGRSKQAVRCGLPVTRELFKKSQKMSHTFRLASYALLRIGEQLKLRRRILQSMLGPIKRRSA